MNPGKWKTFLTISLFAAVLSLTLPVFGAQISIGLTIGPPPAPRAVGFRPASPGPDFLWVEGYWYPVGNHYNWHEGYWTRPPYLGARWIVPHHDGERFFDGYWEGEHGRVDHDHPWTADRERDFREHEHDRDRGRDKDRDHDRGRGHDRGRDHDR